KKRLGSKTIKQYDSPKTPYQRVIQSPYVSQKVKDGMTKYLEKKNPFLLRKAIEAKLKIVFALIASGLH
ncbi:MAG: integrase, partial [Syntrophales bacterium]